MKRIFFLKLIFTLFFTLMQGNVLAKPKPAYVVVDYNNGEVLLSHRGNEKMHPASLTKVMTLYIVFDKLKSGELKTSDQITISRKAASQVPSKLGIPAGSKISVGDAIITMIVRSNNDIAYAVAEHVGGSLSGFTDLMNEKAKEINLKDTHFSNSSGLTHRDNYSTPLDMAKLARSIMVSHNDYYDLFSVKRFKWRGYNQRSTNALLGKKGFDGMKTGYTSAAGFNILTSAEQNGVRVIMSLMGFSSVKSRNDKAEEIADNIFVIAKEKRYKNTNFVYKPNSINSSTAIAKNNIIDTKANDLTVEQVSFVENEVPETIKNNLTDTGQNYSINPGAYVKEATKSSSFTISPSVKTVAKYQRGNYKIQVGAFSSYKRALTVTYNIAAKRAMKNVVSKKYIQIPESKHLHLARFTNMSKSNAYKACRQIRKYGYDCLVIAG